MQPSYKKAGRLVLGLLLLQVVLVTLHLGHVGTRWPPGNPRHERGEFWPFSPNLTYPTDTEGHASL